ncbi:MAG: hypothetical protein AB7E85_01405 [Pseudobdellovibrionaceae bacterium]
MTVVAGTSQNFNFNKSMFSDPTMQPHLEKYYNEKYDALRETLAERQKAEENGEFPTSIQTKDGKTLTVISASKMAEAIPTFDKWLDIQQNVISPFDFAKQTESMLEHARENVARIENDLNPDQPSGVRTVFSDGNKILGYINKDGGLVTHQGGGILQKIAEEANALNLTGERRIAYIREHGTEALSRRNGNLQVTNYTYDNMPTYREFAESWYPYHDVDAAYQSQLQEARASLEQHEAMYRQQMENLNNFRTALMDIMEEAQTEQMVA